MADPEKNTEQKQDQQNQQRIQNLEERFDIFELRIENKLDTVLRFTMNIVEREKDIVSNEHKIQSLRNDTNYRLELMESRLEESEKKYDELRQLSKENNNILKVGSRIFWILLTSILGIGATIALGGGF